MSFTMPTAISDQHRPLSVSTVHHHRSTPLHAHSSIHQAGASMRAWLVQDDADTRWMKASSVVDVACWVFCCDIPRQVPPCSKVFVAFGRLAVVGSEAWHGASICEFWTDQRVHLSQVDDGPAVRDSGGRRGRVQSDLEVQLITSKCASVYLQGPSTVQLFMEPPGPILSRLCAVDCDVRSKVGVCEGFSRFRFGSHASENFQCLPAI